MKFFHVYNERCFKGLEINNLINKDTGLKIQHNWTVPENIKFNDFADKGTRLHGLIKENNFPFYVDRITGGTIYHKYDFRKDLIDEYNSILGDWFLGFQLHESASNRRQDWKDMLAKMNGEEGPYDEKVLSERMRSGYAFLPNGNELVALRLGDVKWYSKLKLAKTLDEFYSEIADMYKTFQKSVCGMVLPCDSFYMYSDLQDKLGMRTFMPEVGCQIPQMRMQIALTRGVASASGKLWGAYYETWIGNLEEGFSMPCFNNDPSNEWYLTQDAHPDDFTSCGANGGSSRRLQKRIYYYSLMSGADYFSEEWGLNCSYSDMNTFELSPYGLAKKEFINDTARFKGVKPIVPFAIVLPKKYQAVYIRDFEDIGAYTCEYLGIQLNGEDKKYIGHVEDVLKLVYMRYGKIYGNEGHVLTNSRFGDLFDIIYEDASDKTLSKYDYLIDTTFDGKIAERLGSKFRVLESGDLKKLENDLHLIAKRILPCYVDSLMWLLSTDSDGRRYVSIFNNEGNERSVKFGDVIRHEADATVTLTFNQPAKPVVAKASSDQIKIDKVDDCLYKIQVPATEFVILEY